MYRHHAWVLSTVALLLLLVWGNVSAGTSSSGSIASNNSPHAGCAANSDLDSCSAAGPVTSAPALLQSSAHTSQVQIPEVNVAVSQPVIVPIVKSFTEPMRTKPGNNTLFGDFLEPINGDNEEKEGVFPENEKEEKEQHEHHSTGHVVLVFLFGVLSMGVATCFILERYLPALPYTCVLFVEGLVIALLQPSSWETFEVSVALWEKADPHLLLFTFLPPLVFGEAMSLNVTLVKRCFWQCMTLAGPGVVLGTVMLAAVGKYVLPYDWDWPTAMLFGSILSATDPVAVVAIFNSLGVSPRLTMIVSGESLFNDGTAIVLFQLCIRVAQGMTPSFGEVLHFFWWMTTMGPLFGALLGFFAVWFLGLSVGENYPGDVMCQVVVTFACAYTSFFIAENEMQSSGVLTLVTTGYVVASLAHFRFIDRETVHTIWHMIEFVGNTVIFVLAGLIFGGICIHAYDIVTWLDCGALLVLYLSSMVVRGVMFLILWVPMNLVGHGVSWAEGVVIVWAGMRGAVGLLMAVIADRSPTTSKETGTRIMFHVGGTAALMLLINGPLMPWVLRHTGLMRTTTEQKTMLEKERYQLAIFTQNRLEHYMKDEETKELFGNAHKERVEQMLPLVNVPRPVVTRSEVKDGIDGPVVNKKGLALLRGSMLRVVKSVYWNMLDEGVLSKTNRVSKVLCDSADIGLMAENKKLADWEAVTEALLIGVYETEEEYRKSMWNIKAILTGDIWNYLQAFYSGFETYQERCITASLAFIHAHKHALEEIASCLGIDEHDRTEEQVVLMEEAEGEIEAARSFLNTMPEELVCVVQSKMLAAKVMHDQGKQVSELAETGVITSGHKNELERELYEATRNAGKLTMTQVQRFVPPMDLGGLARAAGGYDSENSSQD